MFSNDDTYLGNTIEKNGVGVAVMFSRRIVMRENLFAHNWGNAAYGLLLKEIYDAEIEDNRFIQNTVGIFVEGSNRITYTRNTFSRNGWAIKFSGGCESNRITDNAFMYNAMDLVVSSQVNNNTFDGNYWSEYTGYDLDRNGVGDIPHYPVKLYSYVLDQVPEAVVLMRSLFIDIINYSEKVSPVLTPKEVLDHHPKMTLRS
jgi:nitrous oxidase accessory protein